MTYMYRPFYRATPCVSAVFAVARCLSSVTLVYFTNMAEDIVKLLSRPDSSIILVFLSPTPLPNSEGNLSSGGAKYTGLEKFAIFD